ncbi:MAG: MerR family transcriptional regulator [Actinobacteria bacterium]|nr:MerR family transcriptional regulator [Actinomycetota bacterium]
MADDHGDRRRGRDGAVYVISVAAELAGMHPQTLRAYERSGLVSPERSSGNVRRYSDADVERLHQIQDLTSQGLNLIGVKMVLELRGRLAAAQQRIARLESELERMADRLRDEVAAAHREHRHELVPVSRGAIEIWRKYDR